MSFFGRHFYMQTFFSMHFFPGILEKHQRTAQTNSIVCRAFNISLLALSKHLSAVVFAMSFVFFWGPWCFLQAFLIRFSIGKNTLGKSLYKKNLLTMLVKIHETHKKSFVKETMYFSNGVFWFQQTSFFFCILKS